jgi:hypothetical protein
VRQFAPVVAAAIVVFLFLIVVWSKLKLRGPDFEALAEGRLTDAQTQALDSINELNAYLISLTTLMFGGLGWYISQYRPTTSVLVRWIFFSTVGLLAVAYWYAGQAYSEIAGELAQNALALTPDYSRILYYVEIQFVACATASVLILTVFADAVTRGKPVDANGSR